MNDKITNLEIKLSFQEETISELNDALSSQQFQLHKLEEQLELLRQVIQKISQDNTNQTTGDSGDIEFELPPHY